MTEPVSTNERKYFVETDDGVRFLDPLLGVELQENTPTPCLESDPFAGQGLAQLRKMAAEKRLTVQLILTRHGESEDFADILRDFGGILEAAQMVGVEIRWQPQSVVTAESPIADCMIGTWWPEFAEAETSWLRDHGKLALPCDGLYDKSTELAPVLNDLMHLWNAAQADGDRKNYAILHAAFQTVRQWMFVAHLGHWFHQLEKANLLPDGEMRVPLIIGRLHTSVEQKLTQYLGIPTEVYKAKHPNRKPLTEGEIASAKAFADAVFAAHATHEQIAIMMAYG